MESIIYCCSDGLLVGLVCLIANVLVIDMVWRHAAGILLNTPHSHMFVLMLKDVPTHTHTHTHTPPHTHTPTDACVNRHIHTYIHTNTRAHT